VTTAPWARALGGGIGLLIGELAFPNATGIDDARAIPRTRVDPAPDCDKKGKWHCTAKAHLLRNKGVDVVGFVWGEGYGNSRTEAAQAAIKDAQNKPAPGFRARHPRIVKCEKR